MTACINKEKNLEGCTCTYSCGRRGVCCECVAYHRAKNAIPACFFTAAGEAKYDRSFSAFCKDCAAG